MADPEKDKETQETQETQPETELEKELKSEHNHNGDGVAHEAAETENSRAETASIAEASDEQVGAQRPLDPRHDTPVFNLYPYTNGVFS